MKLNPKSRCNSPKSVNIFNRRGLRTLPHVSFCLETRGMLHLLALWIVTMAKKKNKYWSGPKPVSGPMLVWLYTLREHSIFLSLRLALLFFPPPASSTHAELKTPSRYNHEFDWVPAWKPFLQGTVDLSTLYLINEQI